MKITDPDVIKNGEKDLIQAVKDDLDLDIMKKIMQNKMNAESISSKGGEIVVHNNEIAFRLDFSIEISGSLMFDRQGNYISESDEEDVLPIDDLDPFTDETDLEPGSEAKIEDDLYLKPEMETLSDSESETELSLEPDSEISEDDDIQDDIVDEDINDILNESSEFWESKKDD